jgi:diaminohydroxyphosphoribosylaminopyrimidine deaminase/5-amino-6-(5-phosphoribosylamino)uracil reductase
MELAIRLSRRALGTTAENPPVGCVIVKNDALVGLGWTSPRGRPHAEPQALAMAGGQAKGATAYVTLEPCAHHGRTPPCAEALVAAGISRVVAALEDPDPRVSGGGFAILRRAGIEVATGTGAEAARMPLAGFFRRILRKRPYVVVKMAVSADGKIAAGAGQRTRLTGAEVMARVHLMRAESDAILVGLSTVLADDPELTCRLPGMESRSPIRIVADTRLSIPPTAKLVKSAPVVPLWLLATRQATMGPGVTVVPCKPGADKWVDMADALAELAGRGINRLMVEGGAHLVSSLLEAGLVDEFHLFRAPMTLGEGAVNALAGIPLSVLDERFARLHEEELGNDRLTVYGKHS